MKYTFSIAFNLLLKTLHNTHPLYYLSGRLVEFSVSVPTTPGRHEITYDTSGFVPPGVYIARLTTDVASTTQHLVIMR